MARRRLSKSDIKELNADLAQFSFTLAKHDAVEIVEEQGVTAYEVNGTTAFFLHDGKLVPHLRFALERPTTLKTVTVDMGAIKFVIKGADIMRPGITAVAEGIAAGEIVAIVDEKHGKALAIGSALFDTAAMRAATGGKAVKTLHYVGDKFWNERA